MIAWTQIERDFEWDGHLRGIYVRPATFQDWRTLYVALKKYPGVEFRIDGDIVLLPEDIADVFAVWPKKPMLSVKLGSVNAAFHFLTLAEVECDIDPREVKSQVELDALLAFLKWIGDSVLKPVILSPMNFPEFETVRYEPASQTLKYVDEKKG